jgi:hypothetical protein
MNKPGKRAVIDQLAALTTQTKFSFANFKSYEEMPMVIRNGLAIHFLLGHVLSTFEYGCRGPVDKTVNGRFGANTFHLEAEDVLAGGEANIMEYLTEQEMKANWGAGKNLSAESGIGHVVPHMEDIMNQGLGAII